MNMQTRMLVNNQYVLENIRIFFFIGNDVDLVFVYVCLTSLK